MEGIQMSKAIPFTKTREKLMANPEFRKEYDALEDEFALIAQAIAARTRAGKTQAQVAEAMGISQPAVAKIEAGKVKSLDTLQRYATAVGCKVRLELVSN
jgi:DNA-binding XRE family transcriptional regulator